jgi:hypothetical protein
MFGLDGFVVFVGTAAFAIGAFVAVMQERKEALDDEARCWAKAEYLYRRAWDAISRDREACR